MRLQNHTAIHEAGHAVVCIRRRIEFDHVSIEADSLHSGYVMGRGLRDVYDQQQAEDMMLYHCGGYAALVAIGCPARLAREGCGSDFHEATRTIRAWGLLGDLKAWKRKTADLLRQPENVAAIKIVAKYLALHKTLDFGAVDLAVDLADGNCTTAEYEAYLTRELARRAKHSAPALARSMEDLPGDATSEQIMARCTEHRSMAQTMQAYEAGTLDPEARAAFVAECIALAAAEAAKKKPAA